MYEKLASKIWTMAWNILLHRYSVRFVLEGKNQIAKANTLKVMVPIKCRKWQETMTSGSKVMDVIWRVIK